jgi:LysR family transcriptional activator of glutamate synthase operon
VAAAESESFFNTKGDPHRFQSSASKEILELERELGTPLFRREGMNTGVLTEAGKVLLQEARPIIQAYQRMMRKIDDYNDNRDSSILIGTLPIRRKYRMKGVFNRFIEEHPNNDIKIEETDGRNLLACLRDGYYDAVVIRKNMLHDIDCETYRLAADELAAILPARHPLAGESSIRIEELKNEQFFLTNPYTSTYGYSWKLLKDHHISTENVQTSDIDKILPAISEGKGVGLLPVSSLMIARQKGVVAVPLRPHSTLEVVFAVRSDSFQCSVMDELIKVIDNRSKAVPAL